MKKFLAILLLILFVLLAWYSWKWYMTNIVCCEDEPTVEETAQPIKR